MKNPFTPNFGQIPAHMAGRDKIISDLLHAYENAPGDPSLTTILVGARGTGKTALLSYISEVVREEGWISVNVPCISGMMEDIYFQTIRNAAHILPENSRMELSKVSLKATAGFFSAETGFSVSEDMARGNWRAKMTDIIEYLNEKEIGLLITVDEVNPSLEEMVEFASIYQMFIREERKVALLMAGLPHNVSSLLNDNSVSFLRRSCQQSLGSIPDHDVEFAFRETALNGGKRVTEKALSLASDAICGFPFMLQLVGYRAWIVSGEKNEINSEDISEGIRLAGKDLETRVLKSTLDEVSPVGLQFLQAMLKDPEFSNISDIAKRLNKSSGYVSTYKKRLREQGVINEISRGRVEFALPMMRGYLPEYFSISDIPFKE
ncbi:MAG: AAA family ATPase [Eubacteriales bacterium]|nr:AAA family ATPase [Eubacteriales bacterium]